jgi:hypothetical protein
MSEMCSHHNMKNPLVFLFLGILVIANVWVFTHNKERRQVYRSQPYPVKWERTIMRPDSMMVTYLWMDTTGKYPFTKDTFGLDSFVWDGRIEGDSVVAWYNEYR